METLKRKAQDGPVAADNASPLKAARSDAAESPARTTLAAAEPVACVHDVSYPEGYDASASASRLLAGGAEGSDPAKKFPFQLDPFQAEAIRCLDNGESVMVQSLASSATRTLAQYAMDRPELSKLCFFSSSAPLD